MLEERPLLSAGDEGGPPVMTSISSAPIPRWKLILLGIIACILWLVAVFGEIASIPQAQAGDVIPLGLRMGAHAVLVLAPTALAIVWLRSPRMSAGRRRRVVYVVVAALIMIIVAIPALLPYGTPDDVLSMPLRVPTLSLGVALALVDPQLSRGRPRNGSGSSPEVVVGLSFGFACLAAGVILLEISGRTNQCSGGLGCGGARAGTSIAVFAVASLCMIGGLFGAWIGYAAGRWVTKING